MRRSLFAALIGLVCGVVLADEPMPALARVEGKSIPFLEAKGFAFEISRDMAEHTGKPTVAISLVVPLRFVDKEEYEFDSLFLLGRELSAGLESHPCENGRRTRFTISEDLARETRIVFHLRKRGEAATEEAVLALDLGELLDRWKQKEGAQEAQGGVPAAGPLEQWFRKKAEEARLGVATAGLNEAKAYLNVSFAKLHVQRTKAGGNGAAITAAEVMEAAGFKAKRVFGDVVVAMHSAGRSVTLTAIAVGSEAIPEGKRPTQTWTVPDAE